MFMTALGRTPNPVEKHNKMHKQWNTVCCIMKSSLGEDIWCVLL